MHIRAEKATRTYHRPGFADLELCVVWLQHMFLSKAESGRFSSASQGYSARHRCVSTSACIFPRTAIADSRAQYQYTCCGVAKGTVNRPFGVANTRKSRSPRHLGPSRVRLTTTRPPFGAVRHESVPPFAPKCDTSHAN